MDFVGFPKAMGKSRSGWDCKTQHWRWLLQAGGSRGTCSRRDFGSDRTAAMGGRQEPPFSSSHSLSAAQASSSGVPPCRLPAARQHLPTAARASGARRAPREHFCRT